MKAKYIVLMAVVALMTLSFTFISGTDDKVIVEKQVVEDVNSPIGGLVLDDEF